MSSYPLYGGVPPHEPVATSRDAAISMLPHWESQQEHVFDNIYGCQRYGATDDEIEIATGICHASTSARRRGLVLLERVVKTGERRKTSHGRYAFVHVAVEFAPPECLPKSMRPAVAPPPPALQPLPADSRMYVQGGLFA